MSENATPVERMAFDKWSDIFLQTARHLFTPKCDLGSSQN